MAFKMKGSPHKMGKIQGTSGHTSALKQVDEERKAAMEEKSALEMKSPLEQKEDIMVMATRPGSRTVQKGNKSKIYSKEEGDKGKKRNITKTVVNEKTGKTKSRKITENRAGRQIERAQKRAAKGKGSVSAPLEQASSMKSPLEQKLSFMDKLSSVADAFDRYDGPFGTNSIYDEYKNSKKYKREDKRRENLGHKQVKKTSRQGQPYHVTVDKDGNEVK